MNSQFEFNYDDRSPFDQMLSKLEVNTIRLDKECTKFKQETYMWLAGAAATFVLPFWLVSRYGFPAVGLPSTAIAAMSPVASMMARNSASHYKKRDRLLYHHERYLNRLKADRRENERNAHNETIKAMLDEMFSPPQEQQQQQVFVPSQPPINPEWVAEKRNIESIFKKEGKDVTVYSKEVRGSEIHYVFGPTSGIELDGLTTLTHSMKLKLLVHAGFPEGDGKPKIEAQVGKLVLVVNHPHIYGQRDAVPVVISDRQKEPIAAVQPQEQQQPPQFMQDGPSFTIVPPSPQQQTPNDFKPAPLQQPIAIKHERVQDKYEQMENSDSELFSKFLKAPHNWICGKTGGGKTFLTLRLVWDWLQSNPDGELIVCDRNFGKPDRTTGEIFDWNGLDERLIYCSDSEITAVLEDQARKLTEDMDRFVGFARRRSRAQRTGQPFDEVPPEKRKVLIVITEWNALADATKTGSKLESSPCVAAILPILQQGNGYGIKIILDGQSIAVGLSGVSEAARMQTSICMVGDNCTDNGEVSQLASGQVGKQLVAECSAIKQQGKRACIIQLGEGSPVSAIVPYMGYLRDPEYRFDQFDFESPEIRAFDAEYKEDYGIDPDEEKDPWADQPKPAADNPYDYIIEWIRTNHPTRVNDRAFPSDSELSELLIEWFKQQGQQIQPVSKDTLAELRGIVNARRGIS